MPEGTPPDGMLARLVERHVLPAEALSADAGLRVESLRGGVSADVFVVILGARRLVVKQPLLRLRVAQEWLSSPTRARVEAEATVFAGRIRPRNVPEIVDIDDERNVIVMTAAPPAMDNWKARLLTGDIDPTIAGWLGTALADWHSKSATDPTILGRFADRTNFVELRISPFLQRVAEVHPDLKTEIDAVIGRMTERSVCLVHGDFSPKNVLVDDRSFWVIDWEIAHIGDPTFDLAFLVSHLACKAIHRPLDTARYRACAETFVATYLDRSQVAVDTDGLVRLIGGLVLARADGKSPADYFDDAERAAARALGRRVLEGNITDTSGLWEPGEPSR
jgi:5-methylthioribose kinase